MYVTIWKLTQLEGQDFDYVKRGEIRVSKGQLQVEGDIPSSVLDTISGLQAMKKPTSDAAFLALIVENYASSTYWQARLVKD